MATTPEQAIEPFVLMAKKSKGKAAAALVQEALKHPNTYLFGELIEMEGIKALSSDDETKKAYDTLALFAYHTYKDFKANSSNFLELSEKLLAKLKQLSVVSLAAKQRVLPYELLLKELDIANVRALEDLLIDCMYQGLIKGKLDQKYQCVEVYDAISRDIKESDVDHMIKVLKKWVSEGEKIFKNIEENTSNAISTFEANKKQRSEFDEKVEELRKTIKATLEIPDEMTSQDDDDKRKRGNQKRPQTGAK